jgi:predicted Zn-dependent protease
MTAATRTRSRLPLVGLLLAATCACAQGDRQGGPSEASRPADAPPAESLQTTLQHADTSFQDGDYSEARKAYEQVLQISPGHPRATANLATCYLKDRAVKKAQDLLLAYLAGHPDDPAALMVLARARMRQGEMGPAADALRQVLKSHPDFVMAHYNLGFIGYRSRQYDEAEKHLKRALELKPDLPDGHYTLGLTYLALGRYPEAIASLERAVAIEPKHVGARFNLANACARAGRMKEAEKHQAIYAEISGRSKSQKEKDAQVTTSSVKAIQFLLDKKYPEALEEYQRLAGSHPDYAPLYSQIGQLQIRLGKRDEAFASLRKAVELDPKLADPHYLLAGLYRERGETQAADRELEIFAALEAIPEGKSGY